LRRRWIDQGVEEIAGEVEVRPGLGVAGHRPVLRKQRERIGEQIAGRWATAVVAPVVVVVPVVEAVAPVPVVETLPVFGADGPATLVVRVRRLRLGVRPGAGLGVHLRAGGRTAAPLAGLQLLLRPGQGDRVLRPVPAARLAAVGVGAGHHTPCRSASATT